MPQGIPPADQWPAELKRRIMREWFRHNYLARFDGDETAAWLLLVSAVLRGRVVTEDGKQRLISRAESQEECYRIALLITQGKAELR